jgi:Right handed beta helix region
VQAMSGWVMELRRGRRATLAAVATLGLFGLPALASAHLERPSYWPDPAPDKGVNPPAGGEVPQLRGLNSAVNGNGPGDVLVVCQGKDGKKSLARLDDSLDVATGKGFRIRPSEDKIKLSHQKAGKYERWNEELAGQCRYDSVQEAVFDAGNNDRVVIMPGTYTEPKARKAPTNDPKCVPSLLQADASGDMAPSYEYQVTCPNDQNLIYVQGRKVVGDPLPTPRSDRQGIPEQELGKCVRCNLQIEGSGPNPTDVILDGGKGYKNKKDPEAEPKSVEIDVVLRADRADGFVVHNLTTRGSLEHGIYVEETDGYRIERVKMFWHADYGQLAFTSDHGLMTRCDSFGAGDAALYPGAAPETGSQATAFYPDAPRSNTLVKKCDMRGSGLGYSGSMGNAVEITKNEIYGNTTGIASDTLSSAGHPGFPADSSHIHDNLIYSNNFDIYADDSPVRPLIGVPIGTGILYAGMNDARVHDNYIFDNWRNGTFLLAVPDVLTSGGGAEGDVYPGVSCPGAPANGLSTSCNNQYYDNHMGEAPKGFKFPKAMDQFGVPHGKAAKSMPNGNDFWWDEWSGNTGNCWFDNTGTDGTAGSITGPGTPSSPPDVLPTDCNTSVGQGDPVRTAYLIECSNGPDDDTGPMDCDWWQAPAKPGSAAAKRTLHRTAVAAERWAASPEADELRGRLTELGYSPETDYGP